MPLTGWGDPALLPDDLHFDALLPVLTIDGLGFQTAYLESVIIRQRASPDHAIQDGAGHPVDVPAAAVCDEEGESNCSRNAAVMDFICSLAFGSV